MPAQTIAAGTSLNVYAIGRTPANAFVANVTPDSWSLAGITGSVVASDLVSAGAICGVFAAPGTTPLGIAAGPDGNLWFTEYNPQDRADHSGGVVTEFPVQASALGDRCGTGRQPLVHRAERPDRADHAGRRGHRVRDSVSDDLQRNRRGPGRQSLVHAVRHRQDRADYDGGSDHGVHALPRPPPSPMASPRGRTAPCGSRRMGRQDRAHHDRRRSHAVHDPDAASQPRYIAAGPDGNLWFTEYGGNKIGKITTGGVITEFALPTAGSQPSGIALGPDGSLWFTEYAGNRIGRITTAGAITEIAVPTASAGSRRSRPDPTRTSGSPEYGVEPDRHASGPRRRSANGKATFTGHKAGTAVIHAAKYGMTSTDSGDNHRARGRREQARLGVQPLGAVAGADVRPGADRPDPGCERQRSQQHRLGGGRDRHQSGRRNARRDEDDGRGRGQCHLQRPVDQQDRAGLHADRDEHGA